jgi:hypothetical protein
MHAADPYQLLHGPYTAPALRRGDRATCLLRDADVIITAWSDGRIPGPRYRVPGRRGGSGLLVDEELARAVRCELAQAIRFCWGSGERLWEAFSVRCSGSVISRGATCGAWP